MTLEFVLFGAGAFLAGLGAMIMLISKNAVHSALGLVSTMGAIAFLFLLLDAPFLAMIQITVYAGAIMVLFIFVIMLLGADKLDLRENFPAAPALAVAFSVALFFAVGLPILTVQLNLVQPPPPAPQVRVLHVAPDVPAVNVMLNDQVVAEALDFTESSTFTEVPAGDYTLTLNPEGAAPITTTVSLAPGSVQTLIAYGSGSAVQVAVVADDLSTVSESRSSRVVVFNAFSPETSLSLVDFGSEFDANDTETLVNGIAYGAASEAIMAEEGEKDWTFIAGEGAQDVNPTPENVLVRERVLEMDRDQVKLMVIYPVPQFDGSVRAAFSQTVNDARPAFGGPRAIGILLFTEYMLPFQLLAVLLLAAMVGAIVLTQSAVNPTKPRENVRRRVARPLTSVIASQTGHSVVEDAPQLPAETNPREPAGD